MATSPGRFRPALNCESASDRRSHPFSPFPNHGGISRPTVPNLGLQSQQSAAGEHRIHVRPMPTTPLVSHFRLCKFHPCPQGDLCTYPHSVEELSVWNRKRKYGKKLMKCVISESILCSKAIPWYFNIRTYTPVPHKINVKTNWSTFWFAHQKFPNYVRESNTELVLSRVSLKFRIYTVYVVLQSHFPNINLVTIITKWAKSYIEIWMQEGGGAGGHICDWRTVLQWVSSMKFANYCTIANVALT